MSMLEKPDSTEVMARRQEFYAKQSEYSLSKTVRIECPINSEYVDMENSRLMFDVEATTAGGLTVSYQKWFAATTVRNLRVKAMSGGMIGNEIREYRSAAQHKLELTTDKELNTSYNAILEGATAEALPVDTADIVREFGHKLLDHIFAVREPYPAHFHQGFIIEYDLPQSSSELFFTASGTLATGLTALKFKNVRFVANLMELTAEIEGEMVRLLNSNALFVDYPETLVQENEFANSTGGQNYDLVGISGRVKSAFVFLIRATDFALDTQPFYDTWGAHGLSGYRFRMGDKYLNYKQIQVGTAAADRRVAEQTYELLQALDIHAKDSRGRSRMVGNSDLTVSALTGTRFSLGVKVAKAQSDIDESISSTVDRQRNNLRVELQFGSAPGGVGLAYTVVNLDKRIQILPGSQVASVSN